MSAKVEDLEHYCGYYFKYFRLMTRPKLIKRDLCYFRIFDNVLYTTTKERVDMGDRWTGTRGIQSYRGAIALVNGRLYWMELDRHLEAEVTLSILFPSPTRVMTRLEGITLGTGLDQARRILASRMVLEYLGPSVNVRNCMAKVGVLPAECETIAPDVLEMLNSPVDAEERGILQLRF